MTILFHPNICNVMIGRGLLEGFTTKPGYSYKGTAISVFSGVQPLAKDLITYWNSYNSNTNILLAHYNDAEWWQASEGRLLSLKIARTINTSLKTGVASWCVLWSKEVDVNSLNTDTIPSTEFIIGPVSLNEGSGLVRYETDLNIVSGTPKLIYDGSIGANSF